jgi:phosphoribosylformylglycinamidine synthase
LQYNRPFHAPTRTFTEPEFEQPDLPSIFLKVLGSENIASRLPIFENYDKVVQGQTVFEPGMADAGLMQPFRNREVAPEIHQVGAALSVDSNPRYGRINPYLAGVNAVVEGMRK